MVRRKSGPFLLESVISTEWSERLLPEGGHLQEARSAIQLSIRKNLLSIDLREVIQFRERAIPMITRFCKYRSNLSLSAVPDEIRGFCSSGTAG